MAGHAAGKSSVWGQPKRCSSLQLGAAERGGALEKELNASCFHRSLHHTGLCVAFILCVYDTHVSLGGRRGVCVPQEFHKCTIRSGAMATVCTDLGNRQTSSTLQAPAGEHREVGVS